MLNAAKPILGYATAPFSPQGPVLAAQADQFGPLVDGQFRRVAAVDVGPQDPAPERLVGDPEVVGDLAD